MSMDQALPDPSPQELLDAICRAAIESGASDILLHEGRIPKIRIEGRLEELQAKPLTPAFFEAFWESCGAGDSADFDTGILVEAGTGRETRLRVNLLKSMGVRASVLRVIRSQIPDLTTLGVPAEVVCGWVGARQGLALVCGPAGSGKSTTLAALLGWMNAHQVRHVVTIEDPVEFEFRDGTCLFTQREVGVDTPSFSEGLRRCLRQNPDVIFIGEIRDAIAAETALQAAETGHLVLATLHSSECAESLERLESLFEPGSREAVRKSLSSNLIGILCQKLLPGTGGTQKLATEFFTNGGAIRKFIAAGQVSEVADQVATSVDPGVGSFLASLTQLVRSGDLSEEVAMAATSRPQELQRMLRGVTSASASTRR